VELYGHHRAVEVRPPTRPLDRRREEREAKSTFQLCLRPSDDQVLDRRRRPHPPTTAIAALRRPPAQYSGSGRAPRPLERGENLRAGLRTRITDAAEDIATLMTWKMCRSSPRAMGEVPSLRREFFRLGSPRRLVRIGPSGTPPEPPRARLPAIILTKMP